jgi:hypothetical protein
LKGPERFFYDTSSYTGCARFGGAQVIDKENRAKAQRLQVMNMTAPQATEKENRSMAQRSQVQNGMASSTSLGTQNARGRDRRPSLPR